MVPFPKNTQGVKKFMPGKLERNRTKVIRDLASGRPQAEIAREVGIDPASVFRLPIEMMLKRV